MGFVANFMRFPTFQSFENRLRFDKVTESLKVETFLRRCGYNGEYHLSERRYRQSARALESMRGLHQTSENFMNFGPQTV